MPKEYKNKKSIRQYLWPAAIATAFLCIGAASLIGQFRITRTKEEAAAQSREAVRIKASQEAAEASIAAEKALEAAERARIAALPGTQGQKVFETVYQALERGDLSEAAAAVNENQELLSELLDTRLSGRIYYFDGEQLTTEEDGEKLMTFMGADTVFYGEFHNGIPNGRVLALRAIIFNDPRYDYADGSWEQGSMEGAGATGYCYYEGTEGNRNREIRKEGDFQNDLMNGPVLYTSVNSEGENRTWNLTAEQGKTVIDDSWELNQDESQYRLQSNKEEAHYYVVDLDRIEEISWKNLVPWEE